MSKRLTFTQMIKRKRAKLVRKVCGLYTLGKDPKSISQVLNILVAEVEEILEEHKKLTKEVEDDDVDLQDISGLLTKIGEKKLTTIIRRRAIEVREHGNNPRLAETAEKLAISKPCGTGHTAGFPGMCAVDLAIQQKHTTLGKALIDMRQACRQATIEEQKYKKLYHTLDNVPEGFPVQVATERWVTARAAFLDALAAIEK